MSRTGTLADALQNVAEFSRAPRPPTSGKQKSHKHKSRSKYDPPSSEDGDKVKQERKRQREKDREDANGKDKRKHRHRKSEKKSRGRKDRKDETESSDESSDESRERSSSRKDRKRDQKEKKESRRKRRKERERRRKADSVESSSSSEGDDNGLNPEEVAEEIYLKFPDDAKDLKQLLEMVDSGQAVDISGLPNKGLVSLLRKLFLSLKLSSAQQDIYLLDKGARPTIEVMAPILCRAASTVPAMPTAARKELEVPSTPAAGPGPAETKRRVMGPAMPSADLLAAAARLTEAEARLREAEMELENDPLVGPPPPTVVAEAASANDAERFEEVTRMLSRDVGNAYEVLGVKADVEPGTLKKKYWKLSLLVHPDKCSHPQAHEAFMALNKAFKDLQDPTKKAEIDRKVAEQQAREEFEAEMQSKREAAQWRRLRGEAEEGDDELLKATPEEPVRDEWMTKLPPERQAGGPPVQQNTFFSKSEKSGRGDTSIWTDTPADKAQKAKMQYLEAYKQAALTNGPADEVDVREKERADKEAQLMDTYNSHKRSQSLLEKHKVELSGASKKKTKKAEKQAGTGLQKPSQKEDEWKTNHPWKPWDREKDLTAGRQSVNLDPKQFKEGLSSRFGATQDGPRNFL